VFRVAETGRLNSKIFGPFFVSIHPGYKMPRKSISLLRSRTAMDENLVADVFQFRVVQKRRWAVSSHAASVQARIAVERAPCDPVRSEKSFAVLPSHSCVQRNLHAFEKLLNHDFPRLRREGSFCF